MDFFKTLSLTVSFLMFTCLSNHFSVWAQQDYPNCKKKTPKTIFLEPFKKLTKKPKEKVEEKIDDSAKDRADLLEKFFSKKERKNMEKVLRVNYKLSPKTGKKIVQIQVNGPYMKENVSKAFSLFFSKFTGQDVDSMHLSTFYLQPAPPEVIEIIADGINNNTIHELYLQNNMWGPDGIKILSERVKGKDFNTFDFGISYMGNEGVPFLIEFMKNNKIRKIFIDESNASEEEFLNYLNKYNYYIKNIMGISFHEEILKSILKRNNALPKTDFNRMLTNFDLFFFYN